jgi:intracellular multiplication protein IcmE
MAVQTEVKRQYQLVAAAAVLLVVIVGYVAYGYLAKPAGDNSSHLAVMAPPGKGDKSEETPQYKAVLTKYNEKEAADATRSGQSYLSALSTTATADPLKEAPPPSAPAAPPPVQAVVTPPPVMDAAPKDQSGQLGYYGVAPRQLSKDEVSSVHAILSSWADSEIIPATITQAPTFAASLSNSVDVNNSSAEQTSQAAAALLATKIVPDYARTYAVLETSIDTDENSLVTAYVPAGRYAGMQLFASGYKRLNETVDLTFDAMVWKGHSYKVNAKPIDMNSQRSNLSGEVHNHYFSRIVLPAIATGIGATGKLFEAADQQSVITPQGGVITSTQATPAGRNIAGSFVGGLGQTASQVLTQEAARIPIKQILVKRGETIGIQFIGPVLASDDLALAKGGGNGANAPVQGTTASAISALTQRVMAQTETPAVH